MTKSVFSERYDALCRVLSETRKSQGLTQGDVAKRLQKPQSFVSKYEHGERRLDVIEFVEVAEALGVEAEALLGKLKDSI